MKERLKKVLRITEWISSYNKKKFSGDLSAGISTGLMFIPQGMAYALIAGFPPIYGLYAGVVPLLIYPLFGSSRHLSIGPVAIDMLVVGAGLTALVAPESPHYLSLAILLTIMTGVFQLIMGFLQLGSIFNFFSRPVIAGFTLAAPFIIASSQLTNLLGISLPNTQDIFAIFGDLLTKVRDIHSESLVWGAVSIAVLYILKTMKRSFPGAAVILFGSIILAWYINASAEGIQVVGNIPSGLPSIEMPNLNFDNMRELLTTAITLTLVQFMTIASLGRTFAKRNNYIFDANHELIAIGAANFVGSFFRSIPISGSFSRSAASEQANVKTPLANVITSLVVIATLLFLTPIFYYLPMPALAAIIIVSVMNLINFQEFKELFTTKKTEGWIAVFTAVSTLFIGIQEGILLGVVASLVNTLYQYTRPNVAELGLIPGTRLFRDMNRNSQAKHIRKVLILRIDASFSFINADFFRDFVLEKSQERNKTTKYVIIDGNTINRLDTTAIEQLKVMITTLRNWDMELYITGLKGPIRDIITKSGLRQYLGKDHFFREPHEAVEYLLEVMDEKRLEHYYREINTGEEQ